MTDHSQNARLNPMSKPIAPGTWAKTAAFAPALALLVLGLSSCTSGMVETVKPDALDATRGQAMGFTVTGTGKCTLLTVDWGDTSSDNAADVDFGANASGVRLSHTYTGFGGNRIVTARGVTNCNGSVKASVRVIPPFALALTQPTASACSVVPNVPPLRPGQSVHITTNNDPAIVIDFGCTFGCSYNADGEANSSAPSDWPFPGLRKHSLVLRIGTQVEQGGTDTLFTVHQAGPLEVCVNDDKLSDNKGGWGLFIDVHD
jgi:hypothetical protein